MLYSFHLVLNLLFLFVTCCSQVLDKLDNQAILNDTDYTPRVVNGFPAALGDVPYQLSLRKSVGRSSYIYTTFCGGVIISPMKALSAAHCFATKRAGCCKKSIILQDQKVTNSFAVAGTLLNFEKYEDDNASSGAQWRRLKKVIYPRTYKFPKDDIAIVMTLKPFYFNMHVANIPYARKFNDYKGDCLVSGFGRTSLEQKVLSKMLLIANLEVKPIKWCTRKHKKNMENFICTSGMLSDVAKGDSGGPLVCAKTGEPQENSRGILVGIVSGHKLTVGSFFTRVSVYSKYIAENGGNSRSRHVFLPNCYLVLAESNWMVSTRLDLKKGNKRLDFM